MLPFLKIEIFKHKLQIIYHFFLVQAGATPDATMYPNQLNGLLTASQPGSIILHHLPMCLCFKSFNLVSWCVSTFPAVELADVYLLDYYSSYIYP